MLTERDALANELFKQKEVLDDGIMQRDVLREKVQRMKVLLQRSKTASEEKAAELARLQEKSSKLTRAESFKILAVFEGPLSLAGSQPESADANSASVPTYQWCLLGLSADSTDTSAQWVDAATVRGWIGEGSRLIGEWPESMQLEHRRQLKGLKVNMDRELQQARDALREQEEAFAAYKIRAQAALKRLTTDEAQARERSQRAAETKEQNEDEELRELRQQLTSLQAHLQEKETEINTERMRAEENIASAKSAHELEVSQSAASIAALTEELNACRDLHSAALQRQQSDMLQMQKELQSKIQELHTVIETAKAVGSSAQVKVLDQHSKPALVSPTLQTPPVVTSIGDAAITILSAATDDDNSVTSASVPQQVGTDTSGTPPIQTPNKGGSRALLYQRAEQELSEKIKDLREENIRSATALRLANEQRALSEEQLAAVKATLRDVETTLAREKEFFALSGGERSLNLEYLANVLKKFLMTEPSNASERARLAPILCQILQFQPKDIATVESLWKEKPYMGPLGFGWLR